MFSALSNSFYNLSNTLFVVHCDLCYYRSKIFSLINTYRALVYIDCETFNLLPRIPILGSYYLAVIKGMI